MKRWDSRHDSGHGMRMAIGDLARAAAEPGWSRLAVRRAQVGAHALTTVTRDGREIAAEGMDEPFQRLRELSYRADAGTWFTCELEFPPGGRGYSGRVDPAAPPFEDVPPREALAELTLFPREDPPGWLLAALPTTAPLGLPVPGDVHDRWRDHPGGYQSPPPPPITGKLAYLPATTMTARAFGLRQKLGKCTIHLAERPEWSETGDLVVMCFSENYRVVREGMGVVHEGVRSITLDGTALRLTLTPEAADALDTETSFEVRLELPPETIGELRAALSGMRWPVTRAPEMIGF